MFPFLSSVSCLLAVLAFPFKFNSMCTVYADILNGPSFLSCLLQPKKMHSRFNKGLDTQSALTTLCVPVL